jgi:hypothetical protein
MRGYAMTTHELPCRLAKPSGFAAPESGWRDVPHNDFTALAFYWKDRTEFCFIVLLFAITGTLWQRWGSRWPTSFSMRQPHGHPAHSKTDEDRPSLPWRFSSNSLPSIDG